MLTWALCWVLSFYDNWNAATILVLFALIGDVAIFFLIACAIRGWPK